jgi:hypothetical protein
MRKPLDVIKVYLTLAILVGVIFYTLHKKKQDGNIHINGTYHKGFNQNTSYKLED